MRNLLAFLAAAAITFAGLGWYLDWYKIRSEPGSSGHRNVNIDLNAPKIIEDVHKGVEKGEQKLDAVLEKQRMAQQGSQKPANIPGPGGSQIP
jgi:hypothetical protein